MKKSRVVVCVCCMMLIIVCLLPGSKAKAGEFAWVSPGGVEHLDGKDLNGVFHWDDVFITVGVKGTIQRSHDGMSWESVESGTSASLYGASWNGKYFIVVGDDGTLLRSYNGTEWKKSESPTDADLKGVIWSKDKFIAVGDGGTILNSPDGIEWFSVKSPSAVHLKAIAFNNNLLVAVGEHSTIITSVDGIAWNLIKGGEKEGANESYILESILWTGDRFFIGGCRTTGEQFPVLFESADTLYWIENVIDNMDRESIAGVHLKGLVWDGMQVVAVGDKGKVFLLPSCHRCRKVETISEYDLTGIVADGDRLVVVGSFGAILTASQKNIRVVVDGAELDTGGSVVVTKSNSILLPYDSLPPAAKADFDENNRTITVNGRNVRIVMKIDAADVYINGVQTATGTMPSYINERAYVPVRFIFESLGYSVDWDETSNTVAVSSSGSIKRLSPEDALYRISTGAYLIDVRTQEEYVEKHIKGSINIPLDDMESRIKTIVKDKNGEIIVYCASGKRSRNAAELLIKAGYTRVYDLGGITAWPYETETGSAPDLVFFEAS